VHESIPYQFLMDNLFDGVFVVDRERRVAYWNKAMRELTGFSVSEVIGRRCKDNLLVCVDSQGRSLCEAHCPLSATIASSRKCEESLYMHHRDGHRFPVRVRIGPIKGDGGETVGAIQVTQRSSGARTMSERISGMELLSLVDRETDLPNRRYLMKAMATRISEYKRYAWAFGALALRVDGAGEDGDESFSQVMRMAAQTLASCARDSDVVGRWDRVRFMAIVRNATLDDLLVVGERMRVLVETLRTPGTMDPAALTLSVGAAIARPTDDHHSLAARAEDALSQAESDGGNRVSLSLEVHVPDLPDDD
jgi:diguanylate cyclase (GGDEF)-like protein/PAS domain S-box-containing protein